MLRFFLIFLVILLSCARDTVAPDAAATGLIYERGGVKPAAGAVVKFFEIGDTAGGPVDVCTTDAKGRYSVKGLPTGKYNLWAEQDSSVLFQCSLLVSADLATIHDDTLEPSSKLSGCVAVQFPHDPRTVTIHVQGTDKKNSILEENGDFTITGLPAGTWSLLLRTSLPGYLPCLATVRIGKGSHDTLADTLRLYSTDLPFVSGIRIVQDTLAGAIFVTWDKTGYKNCVDYVVFRASCSDVEFPRYPTFATKDTFIIDSLPPVRQPAHWPEKLSPEVPSDGSADSLSSADPLAGVDSLDTAAQCLRYRVAVRTWNQAIGPAKGFTELYCGQKATVTTYFRHKVKYPNPNYDSAYMYGKASVHDTVEISIVAKNLTRTLRSIIWYDPILNDTVARMAAKGNHARELRDTIRYAFETVDSVRPSCLIAVVRDDAGDGWYDTIFVDIEPDFAFVDAGYDTGVFLGTSVHLHGTAVDYFSSITGWEWKVGNGAWSRTNSPETTFIAPMTEAAIACSCAVINDDGKRSADEVIVYASRKVRDIEANISHNLFIKDDGTLWASGSNYFGQLGDGSRIDREEPVMIMGDVTSMSAGSSHTLILKNDGTLWGCGDDSLGQLGDGVMPPHTYPVLIATGVKDMAAGSGFSLFLKTDQSVWACGDNSYGQLGDGSMDNRDLPVKVMEGVQDVAAGESHSVFCKTDGTVLTCGSNEFGQLGIDSALVRHALVPQPITGGAESVRAGFKYTLVLKSDRTMWGCGYNEYGQLGDTSMENRYALVKASSDVRSVVAGAGFSMTVKNSGDLWVCGWNYYGNWGNGSWEDRYMPSMVTSDVKSAAAGLYYGLVLKNDGSVWTYGISEKGAVRIIPFMDSAQEGTD
jgi:alpha-tubulin suppressor-like RCC1 family protein